jgi:hypothetical protein
MVTVSSEDLIAALDFVSSGQPGQNAAYLSMDTGEIYWVSEFGDQLDELPDDLGRALALRFCERQLPQAFERVRAAFQRRGAYATFKDIVSAHGLIDEWYAYEAASTERALAAWCEANHIVLVPSTPPAP